ncbi:MAG: bacteriochlorophyll 4-vinyl reductase [Burkholderiales bacterium]
MSARAPEAAMLLRPGPAAPRARIGPNAITRVAQALELRHGRETAARVFARAGLAGHLADPPTHMVPEDDVTALAHALRDTLPPDAAVEVAREAGRTTADYLLARRIPRPVQAVLRVLPAALAARVLVGAIARHAWTFAGSGEFAARWGRQLELSVRGNPMCRGLRTDAPACDYYAATFERLFRALVQRDARVAEIECEAAGGTACRFSVRW